MILVDTDVLIWITRKDPQASAFLDSFNDDLAISDVTYMELIQGAKNQREAQAIDKTLKNMEVRRLPIATSISGNRSVPPFSKGGLGGIWVPLRVRNPPRPPFFKGGR